MNLGTGANLGLYLWVNRLARDTPWLHPVAVTYAGGGAIVLLAALLLYGLWARRHGSDRDLARAGWAGIATVLAVAINQPIVQAVHEPRPYATHAHLLVLASRSTDPGFPSDHATMAGACAVGLLLVGRRVGLLALAAGLVLLAARVYVGAHYPLDVAAGFAVGALVAGLGWVFLATVLTGLTRWVRGLPVLRAVFLAPRAAGR